MRFQKSPLSIATLLASILVSPVATARYEEWPPKPVLGELESELILDPMPYFRSSMEHAKSAKAIKPKALESTSVFAQRIDEILAETKNEGADAEYLSNVRHECRLFFQRFAQDVKMKEARAVLRVKYLRDLLNAEVFSVEPNEDDSEEGSEELPEVEEAVVARWEALQREVPEGDALFLAERAYARHDYTKVTAALKWAAPGSPLAALLNSRVLLREAKPDCYAEALKQLTKSLEGAPVSRETPDLQAGIMRIGDASGGMYVLAYPNEESLWERVRVERALLLIRLGNYRKALEELMRTGAIGTAVAVAERCLSITDFKAVVDGITKEKSARPATAAHLRAVLARRLMREYRVAEAGAYFSDEVQPVYAAYVESMQKAYSKNLPEAARSAAFESAADILIRDGEALFKSETGPVQIGRNWKDLDVESDLPGCESVRKPGVLDRVMRFRAAELISLAAGLLPNGDERTARLLVKAGRLHADKDDPTAAEPFYKSLVTRCPETELGREALRLHWLPKAK